MLSKRFCSVAALILMTAALFCGSALAVSAEATISADGDRIDLTVDLTSEEVPDGFYLVFDDAKKSRVEKGHKATISTTEGAYLKITEMPDLGSDYQTGNAYSRLKLLKLQFAYSGTKERISLDDMKTEGFKVHRAVITATLDVEYRMIIRSLGNGSFGTENQNDIWGDQRYARKGDVIKLFYDAEKNELVSLSVEDSKGNSVPVNGTSFVMPADYVYFYVTINKIYHPKTITVMNSKNGVHGTITPDRTSARCGEKVTVTYKPDSGYEPNLKSAIYTYTMSGKSHVERMTAESGNKASFIMPDADVTVRGVFRQISTQSNTTGNSVSNNGSNSTYSSVSTAQSLTAAEADEKDTEAVDAAASAEQNNDDSRADDNSSDPAGGKSIEKKGLSADKLLEKAGVLPFFLLLIVICCGALIFLIKKLR